MRPADVTALFADLAALHDAVDSALRPPLDVGLQRFVTWFDA